MFVCFMSIYMNARKLHICFCLKAIKYLIYCVCSTASLQNWICSHVLILQILVLFLCLFNTIQSVNEEMWLCICYLKKKDSFVIHWNLDEDLIAVAISQVFQFQSSLSEVVADFCLLSHKHAHLPTLYETPPKCCISSSMP